MNDSAQKPRRGEFRGENHDRSHSETETEDVHMLTQKVKTWDVLQSHPIAKDLEVEEQLALLCEFLDLYEDLQGMSLAEFIDASFASDAAATDEVEPEA